MNLTHRPGRALTTVSVLVALALVGTANTAHADDSHKGKPATAPQAKKDAKKDAKKEGKETKKPVSKAAAASKIAEKEDRSSDPGERPKKAAAKKGAHGKTAKSGHAPKRRASSTTTKKTEKKDAKGDGDSHPGRETSAHDKKKNGKEACLHSPVELFHLNEKEKVALTLCDGKPNLAALGALSSIARPHSVAKPENLPVVARDGKAPDEAKHTKDGKDAKDAKLPPGIKIADAGLLTRLQGIADQFKGKKISVVSGYRPTAKSGYHKDARALDVHVDGVRNEDLVTFCRSLPDTGCGYYPKSSFVHVDVRPKGTGHVYWIDASGPGETAKYVAAWPPPKDTEPTVIPRPDPKAPTDEHTHGTDKDDDDADRDRAAAEPDGDISPTG